MINLQSIKINNISSLWLKLAGYSAAILIGLVLFHHFMLQHYASVYKNFSAKDALVRAKYMQYENLTVFKGHLADEKNRTQNIVSAYGNISADAKKTENSYLDQIGQVAAQTNIKLDRITPGESNGKTSWDISYNSEYKGICDFFSLLEKYFKVEKFQITSGEFNPKHKVSMTLSALAEPTDQGGQSPDTRDIFDLFNEASGIQKNIEMKENETSSVKLASGKDPMSFTQTIFVPEKKAEEKRKLQWKCRRLKLMAFIGTRQLPRL